MSKPGKRAPRPQGEMTRDLMLSYINDYVAREGWAPTMREMADFLDKSTETVRVQLIKLAEQGRIKLGEGPRAIKVLK